MIDRNNKALVDDNAIWLGQSINIAEFDAG